MSEEGKRGRLKEDEGKKKKDNEKLGGNIVK